MINPIYVPLFFLPYILLFIWNSPQHRIRREFLLFLRNIEGILLLFILGNFLIILLIIQDSFNSQSFVALLNNIFLKILLYFLFLNFIYLIVYTIITLLKIDLAEEFEGLLKAFWYLFILGSSEGSVITGLENNIVLNQQLLGLSIVVLLFFIGLYYYQFFYLKSSVVEQITSHEIEYRGTTFTKWSLIAVIFLILVGIEVLLIITSFNYVNIIPSGSTSDVGEFLIFFSILTLILLIVFSLVIDFFQKYNFIVFSEIEKRLKCTYLSTDKISEEYNIIPEVISINKSKLEITTDLVFINKKEKEYYSSKLLSITGLDLIIVYDSICTIQVKDDQISIPLPKTRIIDQKFVYFSTNQIFIDLKEKAKLQLFLV